MDVRSSGGQSGAGIWSDEELFGPPYGRPHQVHDTDLETDPPEDDEGDGASVAASPRDVAVAVSQRVTLCQELKAEGDGFVAVLKVNNDRIFRLNITHLTSDDKKAEAERYVAENATKIIRIALEQGIGKEHGPAHIQYSGCGDHLQFKTDRAERVFHKDQEKALVGQELVDFFALQGNMDLLKTAHYKAYVGRVKDRPTEIYETFLSEINAPNFDPSSVTDEEELLKLIRRIMWIKEADEILPLADVARRISTTVSDPRRVEPPVQQSDDEEDDDDQGGGVRGHLSPQPSHSSRVSPPRVSPPEDVPAPVAPRPIAQTPASPPPDAPPARSEREVGDPRPPLFQRIGDFFRNNGSRRDAAAEGEELVEGNAWGEHDDGGRPFETCYDVGHDPDPLPNYYDHFGFQDSDDSDDEDAPYFFGREERGLASDSPILVELGDEE